MPCETFAAIYPTGGESSEGAHAPPEQLLRTRLTELVRANQQSGRLAGGDAADLIARVILDIYLSENRAWLAADRLRLEAGIARLRTALELALRSLILDQ
jgi:hypothetical protein